MTREEIMTLGFEDLEKRAAEIAAETADADKDQIEALNAELDSIEERKKALKLEVEKRKKDAEAVASGKGKEIEKRKEVEKMTNKEVRNTPEYIEAFAKYIKTGKDAECRALLTEDATGGVVPVPELVEGRVRAAWENDKIFSRVSKTFVKGNLKVGFEISATDAVVHEEGTDAPAEEELVLGIVNMVPEYIKKWISVSDKVMALGAEEFLAYIYDELTYKIIKKAADLVVTAITSAPATSDADSVGVAQIEAVVDAEAIIDAIAELGDDAQDNVFIASGSTIAAVKKAALTANYALDPFQGLEVIQKDGVTGAIVGDLSGVQANLPEGDAVRFIFDEYSLAEADLVKIVGKLLAAIAVVGPKMFAYITGTPASE
ncbi:phage major capsid protein [Ruminococcus sp.]|uniref:phage major capsid protein n=1 Tax=Ruminococcus sp. TaxID=41978 RepID=UPI003890B6E6